MPFKKRLGKTLFIIVTVSLLLAGSLNQHPVQARSLSIPDIEKEALIALYNSTDGDNWMNNTGWLTDPDPCTWNGISCSGGHVHKIELNNNHLNGLLPSELEYLTKLYVLSLFNNDLTGIIPSEIGNMTNLHELRLFANDFEGSLPRELGNLSNLTLLELRHNNFSGSIPPEIGYLSNLEYLILEDNQFTGAIPQEVGDLSNLRQLKLRENQLSGSIPSEIGNLAQLEYLDLRINKFTGPIPQDFGNLTNLAYLYLDNNSFSGEIPESITNLTNISCWGSHCLHPGIDINYNMLTSTNESVIEYLDRQMRAMRPYWSDTQTVPPTDLSVVNVSPTSVEISWTPIPYTANGGYYEIAYATTPGGPYMVHGQTSDKTVSSYVVDGLENATNYYFAVRTFTPTHGDQQNDLLSGYSSEIKGTPRVFLDVPTDHWVYGFVDAIYNAGLTSGCSVEPSMYCPYQTASRAQIAVFLENGIHYPNWYSPPDVEPSFGDTAGHWAEHWIEALYSDGITAGCSADPLLYCPDQGTTRAQMAVFLLKSKHGAGYSPPDVTPTFNDTAGHWAEDWIEQLYSEGITAGCGGGNYCPYSPVTRAQMAVFLVRTFNLPLP